MNKTTFQNCIIKTKDFQVKLENFNDNEILTTWTSEDLPSKNRVMTPSEAWSLRSTITSVYRDCEIYTKRF